MKIVIEYSAITRCYYVYVPSEPVTEGISRKREAERYANEHGATEIVHVTRSARESLVRMGFTNDSAKALRKEFFS